jgi:predicted phosphodiesterase
MNNNELNDRINLFIYTTKQSDEEITWDTLSDLVNDTFDTELTGNACRKRFYRFVGNLANTPQVLIKTSLGSDMQDKLSRLQGEVKKDSAVKSYTVNEHIIGSNNILVIGDIHEPFSHPSYLDFCIGVREKYNCDTIVFIGDVVDEHALSAWDSDPDGYSAGHEAKQAQLALQKWYDAFPDAYICIGNHDDRPMRRAFKSGIPKRYIRSFEEIWGSPDGWKWGLSWVADGITYEHGVTGGTHAAYNRALKMGRSIVQGHTHINPGVKYLGPNWYALNVGCGLDENAYAMAYGRQYNGQIVLGCGVVLDRGNQPIFIPMQVSEVNS